MLAYILALAVGLGSLALYMAAFFFPEVHRKSDFFWSGLGLFYALVLWVCAGRITGGVLLGQIAGVSLLGWWGWQTLTLRRAVASPAEQTKISPEVSEQVEGFSFNKLLNQITSLFRRRKPEAKTPKTSTFTEAFSESSTTETPEAAEAKTEETKAEPTPAEEPSLSATETTPAESEPQPVAPEPPEPEDIEAAQKEAGASTPVEEAVVEAARPEAESPETDETTPVEEVAPEAELAPTAESPGEGDPQTRETPSEPPEVSEAVPMEQESQETEEKEKRENPPQ